MFNGIGLVMYQLYYTSRAKKDALKIKSANLKGAISRRINKQHRLVYQILKDEKAIKVLMMWAHYE